MDFNKLAKKVNLADVLDLNKLAAQLDFNDPDDFEIFQEIAKGAKSKRNHLLRQKGTKRVSKDDNRSKLASLRYLIGDYDPKKRTFKVGIGRGRTRTGKIEVLIKAGQLKSAKDELDRAAKIIALSPRRSEYEKEHARLTTLLKSPSGMKG